MKDNGFEIKMLILLIGISIFGAGYSNADTVTARKKIFYLNSYDVSFSTFKDAFNVVNAEFPQPEYLIDTEFLDSKRFKSDSISELVKSSIRYKKGIRGNYDLILCSDDNAVHFVLDNYTELFAPAPVVLWGLNDLAFARKLEDIPYITGVAEKTAIRETIEFIRQVQNGVDEIIAIADTTESGQSDLLQYLVCRQQFPEMSLKAVNTSTLTFRDFLNEMDHLSSDKAILKLTSYKFKDQVLYPEEQSELFYRKSKVPVYTLQGHEMGLGFLGGCLFNYYDHVALACSMGREIINGRPVRDFNVVLNFPARNVADHQVLKRFQVRRSQLPARTEVVNGPSANLYISKNLIYVISFILLLLFAGLSALIWLLSVKRKLEKRLRISQQNYETLFRDNHSISLLINPETGKIEDANNTALTYYGYSLNEIRTLNIEDINVYPKTDVRERISQSMRDLKNTFVFAHRKKSGEVRDVEVFNGMVDFNGKLFLLSIVVDITTRMQTEREMIEARQRAVESDKLKTAFLANMSHEIRTPMNSILGFSELLMTEKLHEEKFREFLHLIYSNGEHLLRLINDIIDISKIEANQLKIYKTECRLNEMMDNLLAEFEVKRVNEKHDFVLQMEKGSSDPEFRIRTDVTRLRQILINLLGNAFKFTEQGFIEFGYKVRDDGMIQFYVKDTGIGIPKNMHELIFSAFQTVEDSSTKNYSGSGLGLSITKSLVQKLGGQIWLMSDVGQGARFYFTIPLTEKAFDL